MLFDYCLSAVLLYRLLDFVFKTTHKTNKSTIVSDYIVLILTKGTMISCLQSIVITPLSSELFRVVVSNVSSLACGFIATYSRQIAWMPFSPSWTERSVSLVDCLISYFKFDALYEIFVTFYLF